MGERKEFNGKNGGNGKQGREKKLKKEKKREKGKVKIFKKSETILIIFPCLI